MADPSKLRREFGPLGNDRFQDSDGGNLFADGPSNSSNPAKEAGETSDGTHDSTSDFTVTGSLNERAIVYRDGDFVSTGRSPTTRLLILSALGLLTGVGLMVITALLGYQAPMLIILSSCIPASFAMPTFIIAKKELDMIRYGVREKSGHSAVHISYGLSIFTMFVIVACCGWSIASLFL